MPMRVRSRVNHAADGAQFTSPAPHSRFMPSDLPDIGNDDTFRDVVKKISMYVMRPSECLWEVWG